MKITLQYETQIKRAVGTGAETIEAADGADAAEVLRTAAERHDESVRAMLLTDNGQLRPSLLMFVGDQQVSRQTSVPLTDGDTVTVMLPISGG